MHALSCMAESESYREDGCAGYIVKMVMLNAKVT